MIKKYCHFCKREFESKVTFCPKCGALLRSIEVSEKKNVDVKINISDKKLIIDGREMMYLGEENVDMSDPKYMLLTISKFKDNKYITPGNIIFVDPLDDLREYKCEISFTPNLQIRGRKNTKGELFDFYRKHITIPGVNIGLLVDYISGHPIFHIDSFYEKYIMGDKIMIFIDPNSIKRFFLLYVKKS